MASIPHAVGKYQVIDRLGEGGMGTLYLARDPGLDRLVAIKVLRGDFDDPELRERFSREARTVSNLIHDNIVIIYEYGDFEGQPFIAMQYVAGESLAEIIRRRAYLTLDRKLQMIDELCAGMAFAHRAKIVHRDLKPANIMVDADRGLIKILDFGIARNVDANATLYTQVIGTPSYMSPEQAGGLRVDHRSDIFAIGVVAYELLSYRKAFDGESVMAIQHKILTEDPVPLPQVCPGIESGIVAIVQKALARDPASRYQELKAMRSDLARALERAGRSNEGSTIIVSPPAPSSGSTTPSPAPRLEERRARQIQIHLNSASAALREENYDAAIESCEHILLLDGHHETALALLEKARAGADRVVVERHLAQARAHLRAGALTLADQELLAAARIAATDPAVRALQRELQQMRREAERAMERTMAAEAALTRGRASLEDGAYESALRAATEALAHTPDSTEALALKARAVEAMEARARERELERLATKAVADARVRFDEGHHAAAIGALEHFSPAHPVVAAALDELRNKRGAIEEQRRREEERRRAEEARRRERLERASAWLATGRDRLAASDYNGALQAIVEAEGLAPELAGLGDLRAQALARKAAADAATERQRQIAAHLTEAERLLGARELDGALSEVNAALALDAADARASQLVTRIHKAIDDRRREAKEREARAREAQRLRQEAEAAAERQRQIASHVTEAERLLGAVELERALAEANAALALDAADARASQLAARIRRAIERRQHEAEELEARAREALRLKQEEEDRRRREEERGRAEEREREMRRARTAALLASGEQRLASGDYDGALAAAADAERLEPSLPDVSRLREKARAARDAAAAAREAARIKQEIADRVAAAERLVETLALDQALEHADGALALAPGDRNVQRLRSKIDRAIQDRAKAEAAKQEAELDAERRAQQEAERRRQEALKREAQEKERLERAARLAELVAIGSRQLQSGDFDATLRTVNEAERLDPKSADLKTLRSRALTERAAAEAAAEALAKRERQVAAKVASAARLLQEKKLEKALTDVEAAIALDSEAVDAKELRARIQLAIDERRRKEEAARQPKIDATLVSTRTFDERLPVETTQLRQDQPTQVVTQRPRVEPVVPAVTASQRSRLLMTGIALLILAASAIAIWKWKSPQNLPQPVPTTVQTPTIVVPPAPTNSSGPVDPLGSYLERVTALDAQRQPESVLAILLDALRVKSNDPRFLQRLNQMFDDAQAGALREKMGADEANAKTLARDSYARAETARQAGRQRGTADQTATAIRRSWEARDLFVKSANEARGEKAAADKAAADKAAADKAAAERAAAEKAAAERTAAEKAAAERAAAERAAAERAAAEKAAAERAAAERAAEAKRLAAAAAAAKQRDEQNVRNVVEQYRSAYNNLDGVALSRVVSSALAQVDFSVYRSYTMTISDVDVRIDGDSAVVRCTRQIDARSTRGNARLPPQSQTITMRMRRGGSSWIIESVN